MKLLCGSSLNPLVRVVKLMAVSDENGARREGRDASDASRASLDGFARALDEARKVTMGTGLGNEAFRISASELEGLAMVRSRKSKPRKLCLRFLGRFSEHVGSDVGMLAITTPTHRDRKTSEPCDPCWLLLRTGARAMRFDGGDKRGCTLFLEAWWHPSDDRISQTREHLERELDVTHSPIMLTIEVASRDDRFATRMHCPSALLNVLMFGRVSQI